MHSIGLSNMVGRGKRARDHMRGCSEISPPQKCQVKTARKRKQAIQTSITEWVADEDNVNQTTQMKPENTPPTMLSPILSQPLRKWREKCTSKRTNTFPHLRRTKFGCQCVFIMTRLRHM